MYSDDRGDQEQRLESMLNAGELQQALELLDDWYAREPWNSDVLMRLAVVHWLSGEPARTLRDLDALLAMDPDNAEVLARRAQALLTLGKREDAEATLARAEAIDPTTPGVLLNRALIHEEHGEYSQAIASLTDYLERLPQDHLAIARRSHLHRQLGNYPQALQDAQACVAVEPHDPEAHFALALAQVTMEQGQQALASCDECLQLQQTFLPALRLKIDLLCDLLRLPEAHAAFALLEAQEPQAPQTALLHARLATEQHDFTAALQWITAYLDDCPDEAYGYYRRGMIYFQMGRFEQALVDFQEYARMAPQAIEAYEQQFLCYLELARYPDARQVAKQAVELQPANFRLQYNAGFAALLCGDVPDGKRRLLDAVRQAPTNTDLVLRIHMALSEYVPIDDRLEWLRAAVLDCPSPVLHGLLAEACLEHDDIEEALQLTLRVLNEDPSLPFGYLLGIKALCQYDRYPEALAMADAGVAMLPQDGRLRLARALVLRDVGRSDEALQELLTAESLLPGESEVVRQRALVYGSRGQIDEALRLLREALHLDSESAETHFWLGYFLLHRKQYREALTMGDAVLRMAPSSMEGHAIRSAALRGLRRRREADAELAVVREHDNGLLERLSGDPVIAALLGAAKRTRLGDRLRRSAMQCWQMLWSVM